MQSDVSRQRGFTFVGLVVVGVVLAYLVIIGAKVAPSVSEYFAIQKAVNRAAADNDSIAAVRQSFDRSASAGYISSIAGKDLSVVRDGERMRVSFAYDKEIPLGGWAYLLIKYHGDAKDAVQ